MAVELKGEELGCVCAELGDLSKLPQNVKGAAGGVTTANFSFNSLEDSSLPELAQFTALETLVLDNNDISSLASLPDLPKLHTLWLNKNQITDLDEVLTVLTRTCPRLTYLSLLQNPCAPSELTGATEAEYSRYRLLVKYRFPTLQYLDAAPFTEKEAVTAKERGQFYQSATVKVKPTESSMNLASAEKKEREAEEKKKKEASSSQANSPTKSNKGADDDDDEDLFAAALEERENGQDQGAYYSKQQQFYSGKSSEGNRFIRDDVL